MQAYLHIPFCRQRCSYCRFALDPRPNTAKIAKYLAALKEEIQTYLSSHSNTPIETIYFGGGTPSVLSSKQLSLLLDLFPISQRAKDIEITIECNPEDITKSYANDLVSLGCTRVSLGVQTMNDIGLQIIGRSISTTTLHALEYLTHSGHRNINLDFILGLPDVKRGEIL